MAGAELAALAGGAIGILVGAGAMLAFRASERQQSTIPETEADPLDPAAAEVLAVLGSSWVVMDGNEVVRSGPAASALGVVRDGRLAIDELRRLAGAVGRDGEIREAEVEAPRRGTRRRPVLSARVAPLPGGLVLVLIEDRSDARRVDDVRRDFVANVSHELKTPVGALSLLAEAVEDASDDPDAVRRFAGRMQHEANRLSQMVNELIDLSRLQGDDPLSHAREVGVDALVAEAVDRTRTSAHARDIGIAVGGETGLRVYGDQEQLVTALRNLLDNAVKYSPARTRVAVATRHEGDRVEISVTDQGIGIPEADVDRIFERFYRVDPARSRATGGTGLGLSIVKHVCANHGGEVDVWSSEGSGSTFTLRLPLHTGHETAAPDLDADVGQEPPAATVHPIRPAVTAPSSNRKAAQ